MGLDQDEFDLNQNGNNNVKDSVHSHTLSNDDTARFNNLNPEDPQSTTSLLPE